MPFPCISPMICQTHYWQSWYNFTCFLGYCSHIHYTPEMFAFFLFIQLPGSLLPLPSWVFPCLFVWLVPVTSLFSILMSLSYLPLLINYFTHPVCSFLITFFILETFAPWNYHIIWHIKQEQWPFLSWATSPPSLRKTFENVKCSTHVWHMNEKTERLIPVNIELKTKR